MRRWSPLGLLAALALGGCPIDIDLGETLHGPDVLPPGAPCVTVDPLVIDFGVVGRDREATRTIVATNRCAAPVAWRGYELFGDPGFSLGGDAPPTSPSPVAADAPTPVDPEGAFEIAPGGRVALIVRYTGVAPRHDAANVLLRFDDPATPHGILVRLEAGGARPCLATLPKSVDFGGRQVGTSATLPLVLHSCGTSPVTLKGLAIRSLSGPVGVFDVGLSALPLTLAPGERLAVDVRYAPQLVSAGWPATGPHYSVAEFVFQADDFDTLHAVDVRGFGVSDACPQAVISVADDVDTVTAPTPVELDGRDSLTAGGPIVAWQWRISEAPAGFVGTLVPSPTVPHPLLELTVPGTYVIELDVVDVFGRRSCVPATRTFVATPPALRVALTWVTPNDPDPDDEGLDAGVDLDLHLLHPFAVGADLDDDEQPDGWFDVPFDAFFHNPTPRWAPDGVAAPSDPRSVRDDRDGAGPEVVQIDADPGVDWLVVGVHAWDDHGFGASFATLRVFSQGALVFESAAQELLHDQLWEALEIRYPGPTVTPLVDTDGAGRLYHGVRANAELAKP